MVERHTMIEHVGLTNDFSKSINSDIQKSIKNQLFTDNSAFNFDATSLLTSPSKGLADGRRRMKTRITTLPIKIASH